MSSQPRSHHILEVASRLDPRRHSLSVWPRINRPRTSHPAQQRSPPTSSYSTSNSWEANHSPLVWCEAREEAPHFRLYGAPAEVMLLPHATVVHRCASMPAAELVDQCGSRIILGVPLRCIQRRTLLCGPAVADKFDLHLFTRTQNFDIGLMNPIQTLSAICNS